jgi:predicted RNase H-like HicB family nuclease
MRKRKVKIAHLLLTVERNGDGFLARCPVVQGAFAEGDTVAEAIFNCVDVVGMIGAYRKERGERVFEGMSEDLTTNREISFTMPVEV